MLRQRAKICGVHHPAFRLRVVFSGILWPLRFFRQTLELHQALHLDNHFLGRLILLQKLVANIQASSLQHRIDQRQHFVIMQFLTCRSEELAQAIANMTVFGSAAFLELHWATESSTISPISSVKRPSIASYDSNHFT